jgi:hypothetical protein
VEVAEIEKLNIANLSTPSALEDYRRPRREAAALSGKNARELLRKEKIYFHAWTWIGRAARLAFLSGLALLLAFAIRHM